jgi:hypothetical protein
MDYSLVPDGSVGIALDTNVFWLLKEEAEPSWYSTFLEMRANGYLFSLADHTFAEVFNQFERGRLTPEEYERAVDRVEKLLNPEWPILPGKRKLATSCGIPSEAIKDEGKCFDLGRDRAYSQAIWKHLSQARSKDDLFKSFDYVVGGNTVHCDLKPDVASQELEEERKKWRSSFPGTESVDGLNQDVQCQPPLTVRLDAAIKYRKDCEKRYAAKQYHPDSGNSHNDGIDYNMTWVFVKKMLLCTAEKKFTGKIRALTSFQSGWIYRPEELAEAYKNGSIAKPAWLPTPVEGA